MGARWLETDTASNVNISAATACGAYTANADRLVVVDVCVDAVVGNGDYVMYVTKQINGAGSAYIILPKTTMTAGSGETAISGQSGMIAVRSGDILTVYVDGLAGDTTTPDYTTRWFELTPASIIADAVWDEATSGHTGAGSTGKALTDANDFTDINAATLSANVAAIKGKTDNLPASPANEATLTATAHDVWAYATRTLTGFTTTEFNMIGPVRSDGRIDAIAGDDYYAADGRGMRWSDTAWPNLTGATVNFISGSTTIAMTVVTAGSGEQTVNLDVPKATSAAMKGQFKFIIRATLTNAHVVTLLEGEGRFK
jgi:hypothetical protein